MQEKEKLKDVLVLAWADLFWVTMEAEEAFPNILYTKRFCYDKVNLPSRVGAKALLFFVKALCHILVRRPKVVLLASVDGIVFLFTAFKRWGLLPGVKLVFYTISVFRPEEDRFHWLISIAQARYLDRIIIHNNNVPNFTHPSLKEKLYFVPAYTQGSGRPARSARLAGGSAFGPCGFDFSGPFQEGDYIFSGGATYRDYPSLIEASRGLPVRLRIAVTSEKFKYNSALPENCEVIYWTERTRESLHRFLELIAGSRLVAVPVVKTERPFGMSVIQQALQLGKTVITTTNPALSDYITHEKEGIRVEPGDIEGYRNAILDLIGNPETRKRYEANAKIKARDISNEAIAKRLVIACTEML